MTDLSLPTYATGTKLEFVNKLFLDGCTRAGFLESSAKLLLNEISDPDADLNSITMKFALETFNDPEMNSKIAGMISMREIYLNSPLRLSAYANLFKEYLRPDVYNYLIENEKELESFIDFNKDFDMHFISADTAIESYMSKLKYSDDPSEIVQFAWIRVAVGKYCSSPTPKESVFIKMFGSASSKMAKYRMDQIKATYTYHANNQVISASPTIFNMGFLKGAPSSCMIFGFDDSMEDIMAIIGECGLASKNNAGLGVNFSNLRHSGIGKDGVSNGVVPLLKVFDYLVKYANQGGKRPGAMTAHLRDCHYDFPEFIRCSDKVGEESSRLVKVNTSVMLSDLFRRRVKEGGTWTVFCPHQTGDLFKLCGKEFEKEYVEYERLAAIWKEYAALSKKEKRLRTRPREVISRTFSAKSLMKEITSVEMRSAMPYIMHYDNINRKNAMSNVGPQEPNLCLEVLLPAVPTKQTGCCNLSSISLHKCVKDGKFDFGLLEKLVRQLVRDLNAVIDNTRNVSEKALRSNNENRPIGIGVSGFGDMCNLLDLPPTNPDRLPLSNPFEGAPDYEFISYKDELAPDYSEDALKERELNPEVAALNFKIFCCMYYTALDESCEEAIKYGSYKTFPTSPAAKGILQFDLFQQEQKETGRTYPFSTVPLEPAAWGINGSWAELKRKIQSSGLRNSMLLCVMPTASTASLLNNSESTEFLTSNMFNRKVLAGEFLVVNHQMVADMKRIGLWTKETYDCIVQNRGSILSLPESGLLPDQKIRLRFLKEKYLTMFEIKPSIMIALAAQRQVVIDHSQSFNLYIESPSEELLEAIHDYTGEMGMKTGMYYLRTRAPTQQLGVKEDHGAASSGKGFAGEITVEKEPEVCTREEGCISCQ